MLLLDTNIVIYLHNGQIAESFYGENCCISVVTEIELLSFSGISQEEESLLSDFFREILILPLDEEVKRKTIALKKKYKLKIPDAIICATAISNDATLLTNDRQLFNIAELRVRSVGLKLK
jgi:predicted nucleic acid-binding protein